jgi:hypothetical protein
VFYLFAVLGVSMFRANDPWHFGKLDRAMLTLFRVATYEDWTDVMYINILGCENWNYNGDDNLPKGYFFFLLLFSVNVASSSSSSSSSFL